ncbi:hypothetical protein [Tenggerimyces flavus]|uniref:Uncharacterized protein n=1 Tax=Tenggerimyces flavus TaxID=1708749 RepID=A0ABV7Y8R9_9ACTN|nr:hypothetical protein [Tenggerimyces flavus]MBM7783702.1 hypothetical protein [Tenggerimyces flavus]
MTVLDSPPVQEVPTQGRWWMIPVALVLLAGLTWVAFTSLYSPIQPNGFGGGRGGAQLVGQPWNGEGFALTGPVNGTSEVLIGLDNDGPLTIRLLGDDFEDDLPPRRELSWAPDMSPRDNLMGGYPDEVRPFPVTLAPGEQITLVIKVTKEGCVYSDGGAGGAVIVQVPLRWSVLGRERTHTLDAEKPDTGMRPIKVCPMADEVNQVQ